MARLTENEIQNIIRFISENVNILNMHIKQDEDSGLIIKDDEIKFFINSQTKNSRNIYWEDIFQQIKEKTYPIGKNPFYSWEVDHSPFEADREENRELWVHIYNNINFPFFMPIILTGVLLYGKIIDFLDFYEIYRFIYTEEVPENEQIPDKVRKSLMVAPKKYNNNIEDRLSTLHGGEMLTFQGENIEYSKVIRFKKEYLYLIKGLPFNEFTSEQLLYRMYKVYPTLLREIEAVSHFMYLCTNAFYDLELDLKEGIDGVIEGYPYYCFVDTKSAKEFHNIKIKNRHPELKDNVGIAITKPLDYSEEGIQLVDISAKNKVIDIVTKGKINGIYLVKSKNLD